MEGRFFAPDSKSAVAVSCLLRLEQEELPNSAWIGRCGELEAASAIKSICANSWPQAQWQRHVCGCQHIVTSARDSAGSTNGKAASSHSDIGDCRRRQDSTGER